MSIIQNLVPSTTQLPSHLELMKKATEPILQMLSRYKSHFLAVGQQSDDLYRTSKKILASLEEEIEKELKPEHLLPYDPQSVGSVQTMKTIPKYAPILQQLGSKSVKRGRINSMVLTVKARKHENVILEAGIYVCFLCLRQNSKNRTKINCIWSYEPFYLDHLKRQHCISPQFELILLGTYSSIPFTHVYFKGTLLNLFKNSSIFQYICLLYFWNEDQFRYIYICSCVEEQPVDTPLSSTPIFYLPSEYYWHLKSRHQGKSLQNASHRLVCNGRSDGCHFRAYKSSTIAASEPVVAAFDKIQREVLKETNLSIENLLIEAPPLHRLQAIAEMNLNWKDAFLPLPNSYTQVPTLREMKDYLAREKREARVKVDGLNEEENGLLNLQISLLNPERFICGECRFISTQKDRFIMHIYHQHEQIHPHNSHHFAFLENCN